MTKVDAEAAGANSSPRGPLVKARGARRTAPRLTSASTATTSPAASTATATTMNSSTRRTASTTASISKPMAGAPRPPRAAGVKGAKRPDPLPRVDAREHGGSLRPRNSEEPRPRQAAARGGGLARELRHVVGAQQLA